MGKEDTTNNIKTKKWEYLTIRLPKELKDFIYMDAHSEFRPIGMHIAHILTKYLNEKRFIQ